MCGSAQSDLRGTIVNQCSLGINCTGKIVVSAKQVADSFEINVVSACVFVNLFCGDSEAVTWCTLVRPGVVSSYLYLPVIGHCLCL